MKTRGKKENLKRIYKKAFTKRIASKTNTKTNKVISTKKIKKCQERMLEVASRTIIKMQSK